MTIAQPLVMQCVDEIDSTQTELMRRAKAGQLLPQALLAKTQSAGRGRSGKSWYSPKAGDNLYLSVLLPIDKPVHQLSGLSLAFGIAARRALVDAFADEPSAQKIMLKWPNDLLMDDEKLGGILVEVARHNASQSWVVAGIGINIYMPATAPIEQRFTSLSAHELVIEASELAQPIVDAWTAAAEEFSNDGFVAFGAAFVQADALFGREITLSDAPENSWVAHGVDEAGALIARFEGFEKRVQAGEVSVRLRPNIAAVL